MGHSKATILLLLVLVSISVGQSWNYVTSLPTTRVSLGLAQVNNRVYAIGGYLPSTDIHPKPTETVEQYNPTTYSWSPVASMNEGRASFVTTIWHDLIYVIGGKNGGNTLRTMEVYNSTTDTWTELAQMSDGRYNAFGGACNGFIYIFGGIDEYGDATAKIIAYNIEENVWTNVGILPLMLWGSVSVVIDDLIYISGGATSSRSIFDYGMINIKNVMVYNPATNNATWLEAADSVFKYTCVYGSALNFNGKFYMISGQNFYKGPYDSDYPTTINYVQYFDPATNKTAVVNSVQTGRAFFGSAVLGSSIVIAGGQSDVQTGTHIVDTPLNSVEQYSDFGQSTPTQTISITRTPSISRSPSRTPYYTHTPTPSRTPSYATSFMYAWVMWTPMEISHNAFVAVAAGGKIYAMSGIDTQAISVYDPTSNLWSTVGETPVGYEIYYYAAAGIDDLVYIFGGTYDYAVSSTNFTLIYNTQTNSWSQGAEMITPRTYGGAARDGDLVYLAGGEYIDTYQYSASNVDVYNSKTNTWSTITQLPVSSVIFCGVAVLKGKLYIIGGTTIELGNTPLGTVYIYDIGANTWSIGPPLLVPVYSMAVTTYGGFIYVTGGVETPNYNTGTTYVQRYDPATNSWSFVQSMITYRSRHGIAVLNEQMYVIGGVNDYDNSWNKLKSVELYLKVH